MRRSPKKFVFITYRKELSPEERSNTEITSETLYEIIDSAIESVK